MDRLKCRAFGKINLMLNISGVRDDGYHTLETVMQTVSLHDAVDIRIKKGSGISLRCDLPYIPTDNRNIAWNAARGFMDKTGIDRMVEINIKKTIPVGGGMGGGSADGAAVINMLNRMTGFPLAQPELDELALSLGADVPFCLRRGTYLAEGVGEQLSQAPAMPDCYIVVCKPRVSVSSKAAYGVYDRFEVKTHFSARAMMDALRSGDITQVAAAVGNSFELPISNEHPEIADIKNIMLKGGALSSAMTGSGSVVFGIFEKGATAHMVKDSLRVRGYRTFCVRPVGNK